MKYSNKILFISFGLLLLAASSYAHSSPFKHTCGHEQIKVQSIPGMHHEDPTGRNRVLADWATLRISTDVSNFKLNPANVDMSNSTVPILADFIQNVVIKGATRWIAATLQVKQYTSPLQAPKGVTTCGDKNSGTFVYLPTSVTGNNSIPDTDLLIVASLSNDTVGSWSARAYGCASDAVTRRQFIGVVQFNVAQMPDISDWNTHSNILIHEISHVLFMNGGYFSQYYDPTTSNTRPAQMIDFKVIDNINTSVLTHPRLIEEAKNYYGCDNITYIPLENEGQPGSSGSHWEKKWFGNEFMVAQGLGSRTPVSRLSLVVAEVSGWYKVNYDMADPFIWLKGRGCDFVNKACLSGRETDPTANLTTAAPEFCTVQGAGGCDFEWNDAAFCNIQQADQSTIPTAWNYFKSNLTGADTFSNGCPHFDIWGGKHCVDSNSQPWHWSEETYGPQSACFVSSLFKQRNSPQSNIGQCYNYTCNPQSDGNFTLDVSVGKHTVTCKQDGQVLSLNIPKTYTGNLTCPEINRFCAFKSACPRGCGGAGTCDNGSCKCNSDRIGPDCLRDAPIAPAANTTTTKATAYLRRI